MTLLLELLGCGILLGLVVWIKMHIDDHHLNSPEWQDQVNQDIRALKHVQRNIKDYI